MTYQRTIWEDGKSYGASSFNNIENGIVDLENRINEGNIGVSGVNKKQTTNLSKSLKKLRMGKASSSFAFMGDSVFYGFCTKEDENRIQENCVADNGQRLDGFYRLATTIYDTFAIAMKKVYGTDKISIIKKTFTGIDAHRADEYYNATGADFTLINYGINDAIGGHTNGAINGSIKPGDDGYIDYVGNIELFLEAYRNIVEEQIQGGSAVVIVTPVKQTTIGAEHLDKNGNVIEPMGTDTDSRTLIDVYEQGLRNLALEYGCPVVDGNDLVRDFDNKMFIDFTHFTEEGFKTMGQRLAAYFIGQSPLEPLKISGNTYLGVNPQLDNINLVSGATLDSSVLSPNRPMALTTPDLYATNVERVEGGLCAVIQGFNKIVWSFYAEQEGMVVIPSFYTTSENLVAELSLDFGVKQGTWSNYWNYVSSTSIDRNHIEPSVIEISEASNMEAFGNGKRYGLHMLNNKNQPVLRVVNKGWHTVMLTIKPVNPEVYSITPTSIPDPQPSDGVMSVYGINVISDIEYKMLTK